MEVKKVTSQVKKTSLAGVDAVVFRQKTFHNEPYRFTEGNTAVINEQVFFINDMNMGARKTYYIGQQSGKKFYKMSWLEWGIPSKEILKGNTKLHLIRYNMDDDYGEDLQGLVQMINREYKGNQYSSDEKYVYLIYGVKDYKELGEVPAGFKTSMLTDYIDDMRDVIKRQIEHGIEPMKLEGKKITCKPRKTVKRKTSRKPNMAKSLENAYKRML